MASRLCSQRIKDIGAPHLNVDVIRRMISTPIGTLVR